MFPRGLSEWSFLAITYFWFPAVLLMVEAVNSPATWDVGFPCGALIPLLLVSHSRMYNMTELLPLMKILCVTYHMCVCRLNLGEWNSLPTK